MVLRHVVTVGSPSSWLPLRLDAGAFAWFALCYVLRQARLYWFAVARFALLVATVWLVPVLVLTTVTAVLRFSSATYGCGLLRFAFTRCSTWLRRTRFTGLPHAFAVPLPAAPHLLHTLRFIHTVVATHSCGSFTYGYRFYHTPCRLVVTHARSAAFVLRTGYRVHARFTSPAFYAHRTRRDTIHHCAFSAGRVPLLPRWLPRTYTTFVGLRLQFCCCLRYLFVYRLLRLYLRFATRSSGYTRSALLPVAFCGYTFYGSTPQFCGSRGSLRLHTRCYAPFTFYTPHAVTRYITFTTRLRYHAHGWVTYIRGCRPVGYPRCLPVYAGYLVHYVCWFVVRLRGCYCCYYPGYFGFFCCRLRLPFRAVAVTPLRFALRARYHTRVTHTLLPLICRWLFTFAFVLPLYIAFCGYGYVPDYRIRVTCVLVTVVAHLRLRFTVILYFTHTRLHLHTAHGSRVYVYWRYIYTPHRLRYTPVGCYLHTVTCRWLPTPVGLRSSSTHTLVVTLLPVALPRWFAVACLCGLRARLLFRLVYHTAWLLHRLPCVLHTGCRFLPYRFCG